MYNSYARKFLYKYFEIFFLLFSVWSWRDTVNHWRRTTSGTLILVIVHLQPVLNWMSISRSKRDYRRLNVFLLYALSGSHFFFLLEINRMVSLVTAYMGKHQRNERLFFNVKRNNLWLTKTEKNYKYTIISMHAYFFYTVHGIFSSIHGYYELVKYEGVVSIKYCFWIHTTLNYYMELFSETSWTF